ncbi:MAG: hypothetical protein KJ072_25880 [Verrucomicrobia bacterium]|nr:hypothetical protein [Verrucomicrobiota bacterium]
MNGENSQRTDQQTGTDANRDPLTGTPVGTGVLVAGPQARSRAEIMDHTAEDAYWRTHYAERAYVDRDTPYEIYQAAYQTGYEGPHQYPGKTFAEVESNLQRDFEKSEGNSTLTWDKARNATRDAWNRVDRALSGDADGAAR